MIVVYTLAVYSFSLQDLMGKDGWHDMKLRDDHRHERPVSGRQWTWYEKGVVPEPKTDFEKTYFDNYKRLRGMAPPLPFPKDLEEVKYLEEFIDKFHIDLRVNGLSIPQTDFQRKYAEEYTDYWKGPPPAYAKDKEE